ncbi:MAG: hypothetical protein MMC33_001038 [Icmadophila ericetorum]|nr:hypothetical protein [Icmadophila ericetorum]
MALTPKTLTLYTSPLSGCSARIRIATSLKRIPITEHLLSIAQPRPPTYLSQNPNGTVPTLIAEYRNGQILTLTQSLSMLEFLEESYGDGGSEVRLLPPATEMKRRTQVRDLAALVACDIQPVQNSRIRAMVESFGGNGTAWAQSVYRRGLAVYEQMVRKSAGKYSVGDEITMADVCLWPMVQGGERVGVDVGDRGCETVASIMRELGNRSEFVEGGLQFHRAHEVEV